MTRRVLITGGAGFIGSHLAGRCVADGSEVHLLLRPGGSAVRLDGLAGIVTHRVPLSDRAALGRCLAQVRPEVIFHLAAGTQKRSERNTIDTAHGLEYIDNLTALLASAAENTDLQMFVRAGSLAEYGDGPTPFDEAQREAPTTVYAAAHVAGTQLIAGLQSSLPFPVVTARLALVYGPMQSEDFFIPSLIRRCLAGEAILVQRPGDRRDLLFVEDVVDALCRIAGEQKTLPAVINIASGQAPTMLEVARLVGAVTGADRSLIRLGPQALIDPPSVVHGSSALAYRELGWSARTMLADGLERTVGWSMRQAGRAA